MKLQVVVMGVAGCGKSTLAQELARRWGWVLIEGDDYHPPGNVAKMRGGIALTDDDRAGWLDVLADLLHNSSQAVLTCSALRRVYRDRLRQANAQLRFVHLALTPEQAQQRVQQRESHYFSASLVQSQFQTLEPPVHEAGVLTLDATREVAELCQDVSAWMSKESGELV